MPLGLFVRVKDSSGEVEFERESRSFTLQFIQQLCGTFMTELTQTVKDYAGDSNSLTTPNYFSFNAEAANIVTGIVVGTDNSASASDDYQLGSICDEGTGTDELNYEAMSTNEPIVSGSNVTWSMSRKVTNNSGSTINILEVGLYVYVNGPFYNCAIRDAPISISVTDGDFKVFEYIFRTVN